MFISRHILSSIAKALKNNQKSIILQKKQITDFQILNIICKHGYIQSYEIRGQYILVTLKQVYWNSISATLNKPFSKISSIKNNNNSISAKKWNKISNISGSTSCYIISTDRGIIDNRSKINIGGFPLLKIL